ncbi:MAG: alpha-L-rhamnosidase, partial [Phycisphaerales bacterium]|nr:alpha-L-rhamnosidase [Phycisphaerales bacterium]
PIRDIVDWPPDQRHGYVMRPVNTVVNAFHYRSLVLMARIAGALGHAKDQRFFTSRARLLRATMNRLLLNPTTGLYIDGIGTRHSSEHANLFALAFGIAPRADQSRIADFLVKQGMGCSVYPAQYLLEALYVAGRGEAALKLMISHGRHSWMHMLQEGSTMTTEAWTFRSKPNEDWNHVWGSAPANIIPRFLMGIRPLTPGFAKALVAPQPGDLTTAKITVPTVHGAITESWYRKGRDVRMTVTLPSGMTARIQLPASLVRGKALELNGKRVEPQRNGDVVVIHGVAAGRQHIVIK